MTAATPARTTPTAGDPVWFEGFPFVVAAVRPRFHPETGDREDWVTVARPAAPDDDTAVAWKANPAYPASFEAVAPAFRWLTRADLAERIRTDAVRLARSASEVAWRLWAAAVLEHMPRVTAALPAEGCWALDAESGFVLPPLPLWLEHRPPHPYAVRPMVSVAEAGELLTRMLAHALPVEVMPAPTQEG